MLGARWLARTRFRLLATAFAGYGLVFGLAKQVSQHVREVSGSPGDDLLLIVAWLLGLLPAIFACSVLAGERLYGTAWRRQVVLGELPADGSLLEPSRLLAMCALVVTQVWAVNIALDKMTDGFFDEYGRIGYSRSVLRSDDEGAKCQVLKDLGEVHQRERLQDALALGLAVWGDPAQSVQVRADAVKLVGQLALGHVRAVTAWEREEGREDTWESGTLRQLRREVAPVMRETFNAAPPRLKRAIAVTLGKLRDPGGGEVLHRCLRVETDATVLSGCLAGLGLTDDFGMGAPAILEVLPRLSGGEATLFVAASWALGELSRNYPVGTSDSLDGIFTPLVEVVGTLVEDRRLPLEIRCAGVDVLRKTGDARIAPHLFKVFDLPDAGADCPVSHVDLDGRALHVVAVADPLRLRVLKALALVAQGNEEVRTWAKVRLKGDGLSEFVRGQLVHMVGLMEAPGR